MSDVEFVPIVDLPKLRELNDNFRRTFIGGAVVLTASVAALRDEVKAELLRRVRAFDRFTTANDPWEQHDLGTIVIAGESFMWKIDLYDRSMERASPDGSDPKVTTRVLTVMRSSEY
jgi:hypothetical protein